MSKTSQATSVACVAHEQRPSCVLISAKGISTMRDESIETLGNKIFASWKHLPPFPKIMLMVLFVRQQTTAPTKHLIWGGGGGSEN